MTNDGKYVQGELFDGSAYDIDPPSDTVETAAPESEGGRADAG